VLWFCTGWGRKCEIVMCAVVSVMVLYMLGKKVRNGDVCCSYSNGLVQVGEKV
jgi:hypothetical protein